MNAHKQKVDLKNLSPKELEGFISNLGKERYRSRQILKWLYQNCVSSLDEMTNLSKDFREELSQIAYISSLSLILMEKSKDNSKKFLFECEDGERIESVLIPEKKRLTLCVSTQVGCAMGCRFCLTGRNGLRRNLKVSEIINQIISVKNMYRGENSITNIVLMGMGEPLANYDQTLKAIELMTHPEALKLSYRKVTLSTVGLLPQLEQIKKEDIRFRLAISINAADEETRSRLMPVNRQHPLKGILEICRVFPLSPRSRITFEYVLIDGENDSPEDAKKLLKILKGIPSKVNLIPLNECPGIPFRRPSEESIKRFQEILLSGGLTAIIRQSRGADISAACGQLQGKMDS